MGNVPIMEQENETENPAEVHEKNENDTKYQMEAGPVVESGSATEIEITLDNQIEGNILMQLGANRRIQTREPRK
jgi:hypothetical protein